MASLLVSRFEMSLSLASRFNAGDFRGPLLHGKWRRVFRSFFLTSALFLGPGHSVLSSGTASWSAACSSVMS
jgi:hypothetical protein